MSADLIDIKNSRTPRVDALINEVIKKHPSISTASQAKYYEEVHQLLAPLARDLEIELAQAQLNLKAMWTKGQ